MLYRGATLADALQATATVRSIASPNVAFMEQLIELEVDVRGSATIDMESYRAARKMKLKRTEDNMGELIANLKVRIAASGGVALFCRACMGWTLMHCLHVDKRLGHHQALKLSCILTIVRPFEDYVPQ